MSRLVVMTLTLAIVFSVGPGAAGAKKPPLLDLTAEQAKSDEQVIKENGGELPQFDSPVITFATHEPWKEVSLRVDKIEFDQTDYAVGQPFVYELLLHNDGDQAIRFPWSPSLKTLDRNNKDASLGRRIAEIYLKLVVGDKEETVSSGVVFGSTSVANSFQIIQPGESIRIRALGQWSFFGGRIGQDDLAAGKRRAVKVEIQVYDWPASSPYKPITSEFDSGIPPLRTPTP